MYSCYHLLTVSTSTYYLFMLASVIYSYLQQLLPIRVIICCLFILLSTILRANTWYVLVL